MIEKQFGTEYGPALQRGDKAACIVSLQAEIDRLGGGSIVNIASDAAKVATPGESVLGGAMAAIVMFSRVTAIEAKRNGIRVNVITPSLIAGTPTAGHVLRDGFSKNLFEKAASLAHLGVAEPDDLASRSEER